MTLVWIWTAILAAALIVEFITMQMVSIWIAVGALFGAILALCGVALEWQIIAACVVAILAIIFLRRFTLKFLQKTRDTKSAENLADKHCTVEETITPENAGLVKLGGVIWTAISDESLEKGAKAVVIEAIGNKLKVKGE